MIAWPLINQMNPAADTLALASIEFDLTKVQEGQQVVIKWQGKPVFVRYRTPAELQRVIADDHAPDLKQPQTDAERTKPGHEKYLVVIGSCTHLGLRADIRRGRLRAGGSAPATARITTPPAASERGPRP